MICPESGGFKPNKESANSVLPEPIRRGLAAAGGTQEAKEFAGFDRQANLVDSNKVAEAAGDVSYFQQCHARACEKPGF